MKKLRVIVFCYHNIGYECLRLLLKKGVEVAAVFTHEDDPSENIWFKTPLKLAKEKGLKYYTPTNPNAAEYVNLIREARPDIIFSFYYRYIISPDILNIPPLGAYNLHGSLLPKYRGRCPVNWVIIKGEKKTGLTLHLMTEKPDRGDIFVQKSTPIRFNDTAEMVFNRLTKLAPAVLSKFLTLVNKGKLVGTPQDNSKSSYFGGRKPQDGIISWGLKALEIYNLVRGVTHPYPGAFTFYKGKKILVWKGLPIKSKTRGTPGEINKIDKNGVKVYTNEGLFQIKRAQIEGSEELSAAVLFKNENIARNEILGA